MTRTASRTSLRRGAAGRCTRGAARPRAHVTATGIVEKREGSAWRGAFTLQLETTVAVTIERRGRGLRLRQRGNAGEDRGRKNRSKHHSRFYRAPRLRPRQNNPDVGAQVPGPPW